MLSPIISQFTSLFMCLGLFVARKAIVISSGAIGSGFEMESFFVSGTESLVSGILSFPLSDGA
jgi:hypothetical protein